jgi:protoheme IX farnesyltransferase
MSSTHATMFGVITGVVGPALLMAVDNTAAALSLANIVLYAGVYTPLKQMHPINTWVRVPHSDASIHPFRVVVLTTSCMCAYARVVQVGSVVGAIPPMIGWAAVTKGKLDLGAWALGTHSRTASDHHPPPTTHHPPPEGKT